MDGESNKPFIMGLFGAIIILVLGATYFIK